MCTGSRATRNWSPQPAGPVLGPGLGARSLICRIVQLFPSLEVVSGWRAGDCMVRSKWSRVELPLGAGPRVHSHDQLPFRLPWDCVGKRSWKCWGPCVYVCFHLCLTVLLGLSHRTKPFEKRSPVYVPTGLCPEGEI